MSIDESKAVVRTVFEAINARALERLSDVVADDVVDHNAVIFMQPEGRGAVEEAKAR